MQKACCLRTRIKRLKKALTMLIEERYKYAGSDGINLLPKLKLIMHVIQVQICFLWYSWCPMSGFRSSW